MVRKRFKKHTEDIANQEVINNDAMFEMEEDEPVQGTFEMDVPERVTGAKMTQGIILVTIEWKPRKNGVKP